MIYFRTDAGHEIGFGHLKRCVVLAKAIKANTEVCFIVPSDRSDIRDILLEENLDCFEIKTASFYADEIKSYPSDMQNIILDLNHSQNLKSPRNLADYISALDSGNINVFVIDGLANDSLRDDALPEVKAFIQPYWGTDLEPKPNAEEWLHGPGYSILANEYCDAFSDRTSDKPTKILLTFGGSDPQGISRTALEGILQFDGCDIRVIIGPYFSETLKDALGDLAQNSNHITLVPSPEQMIEHYNWADLCLCGSGSTRYEVAACGLPAVFAAISQDHDILSQRFASFGTAEYIGIHNQISSQDWGEAISRLHANPSIYINMKKSLSKMRDYCFGTSNLAKAIIDITKK